MSAVAHWWRGSDGRWLLFSIYPINHIPDDLGACIYIAAFPLPDGLRRPLYIGQTGDGGERFPRHEKLGPAIRLGATELHIHFGPALKQERLDIETALRNVHRTPLNEQPSAAPSTGIGALAISLGIRPAAPCNALEAIATSSPFGFTSVYDSFPNSPFAPRPAFGTGIAPASSPSADNALAAAMASPFGALSALGGIAPATPSPVHNALASLPPRLR